MGKMFTGSFSVKFKKSQDDELTDALYRMFDDGCETNDIFDQSKQSSSNCVDVVKADLQKCTLNCENILPSLARQTK